jgi:serine phosphatase RsbU (regulator of sigma subunit)
MSLSIRLIVILFLSGQIAFYGQNKTIDSLKLALKNAKHDTAKVQILQSIGEEIYSQQSDSAYSFYERANAIIDKKIKQYSNNSIEYKCLRLQRAYCLNNIGFVHENKGENQKALKNYLQSLKILEEVNNKEGIAIALNNIGVLYNNLGDISQSLLYYDKGLKIMEELGDKNSIAACLNNIGYIYNYQGNLKEALTYFIKCLKIWKEIGNKNGLAYSLNNIGVIYKNLGESKKAMDYFMQSLKIREKIGDKRGIAESLNSIGAIYEQKNDIVTAINYFKKSLNIREEIEDFNGIAKCYYNISAVYFKEKKYNEAIEFISKSLRLSAKIGYPANIRNAANLLSQAYKATGNYKLALENHELYIKMRDSINNIETQKATITQQAKYEYDKQKIIEDEKHKAELKIKDQKAQADSKKQNSILASVSIVLLVVAFFSLMLYNRFKTTQQQKLIIEKKEKETQEQKVIIEEKQKDILDSINYAKRIQYTLLAHDAFLKENLNEYFTYFNPKDIVSGDFYWATKQNNKFYLAVCDSTGHGVPGAFMSLLNIGFLSEAINEKGIENPNEVFDFVRMKLTDTISKEGQKDGFDGILICFDNTTSNITYAAANNAPVIIREGTILELESDRMPVGIGEKKENFVLYNIDAKPGDMLYLYTDGYPDQFGGPRGKKFMYRQLNQLLLAQHNNPLDEQLHELKNTFQKWKGDLEQVDDVTIIGIKL